MPKKNSDYWKQRFDQVEQAANNKSVKYTKQLEKKYKTAAQQIDEQINSWYQRIAQNNEVSITEARRLLSASELKEFKWTVEEYIKYGQENAIDQSWMKELENASAKFHINRLEALKLEARQQVEQLFAGGQESMYDTLADIYKDSFYRSCFEIQKGVGVGFDVSALDDKQVSKLLMKPWSVDGTNFSEKLWGNKRKLINNLDQELSRMVLTGESPQKAIANIRKAMDSSQFAAKRLVLTEQAYFTTVAQKDAFGELDVEEYEIVATLDSRTSDICQKMDGQHFPVKDMTPGVNAPPFHVFCRTTTCPYFNDEFTVDDKRIAKGDDGEYYEVPANMTYPEWKKSFVDGGSKGDLIEIPKTPEIDIITDAKDFSEYDSKQLQEWETDYYEHNNKVNLTEDEIVALDNYGEGAYEAINAVERFGEDLEQYQKVLKAYGAEEMEKAKEATEHLSSAINKFDLDEDIVVHRAVRDASYITGSDNSIEALQNMVGEVYTDKGYVSTSLKYQSKFAGMRDDAVHMEITVPKGSNGALIDDYVAKDEYEFLINRNQQFVVVDAGERVVQVQKYDVKSRQFVTVDKTERYMKVQLLPDENKAVQKLTPETNNGITKVDIQDVIPAELQASKDYYDTWNQNKVKDFAQQHLNNIGLGQFKVKVQNMKGANGACVGYLTPGSPIQYTEYKLRSTDPRTMSYKVKTALHESYHLKSHGLEHDRPLYTTLSGYSQTQWTRWEETFTECSAHYMAECIGVKGIAPSYAKHLVETLPRLKASVPEFANCSTITDFGKVAYKYRFGSASEVTAKWESIYLQTRNVQYDFVDYSTQYIPYVKQHKNELIDLVHEQMISGNWSRSHIEQSLDDILNRFDNLQQGQKLTLSGNNEKIVFENIIVNAMNAEGVK